MYSQPGRKREEKSIARVRRGGDQNLATRSRVATRPFHTEVTPLAGLTVNPHRPNDRLPYRGAWLNIGPEMIHLMELPNPDKLGDRPEHGGRDRHFCIGIEEGALETVRAKLDAAGVQLTHPSFSRCALCMMRA